MKLAHNIWLLVRRIVTVKEPSFFFLVSFLGVIIALFVIAYLIGR